MAVSLREEGKKTGTVTGVAAASLSPRVSPRVLTLVAASVPFSPGRVEGVVGQSSA